MSKNQFIVSAPILAVVTTKSFPFPIKCRYTFHNSSISFFFSLFFIHTFMCTFCCRFYYPQHVVVHHKPNLLFSIIMKCKLGRSRQKKKHNLRLDMDTVPWRSTEVQTNYEILVSNLFSILHQRFLWPVGNGPRTH